jgi:hypothetical protein
VVKNSYFVADEMTRKIILLFVFEKMEIPMSEATLSEVIMANQNLMTYMDYRDALGKIIETKFVVAKNTASDVMYYLTQDGRACLSHFFTKIPASVREDIIAYVNENRLRIKRSQEYRFNYFKNADNTYTAVMTIKDHISPDNIMELKLRVPTRVDALHATARWKDKAPMVFENIYSNLVEEDK